jgi:hypothetical protein
LILEPNFDKGSYPWDTFLQEYLECEKKGGLLLTIGMLPLVMTPKDESSEGSAKTGDTPEDDYGDEFVRMMAKSLEGRARTAILMRFIDYCRRAKELGVI